MCLTNFPTWLTPWKKNERKEHAASAPTNSISLHNPKLQKLCKCVFRKDESVDKCGETPI